MKAKAIALTTVFALFGLALLFAHGQHGDWQAPEKAKRLKNPVAANQASLRMGKALYQKHCLMCHGEKGDGSGPLAAELKVKPSNLRQAIKEGTEGEIFWKISTGREPMPAFERKLSKEEIWQLVNYIKTLTE